MVKVKGGVPKFYGEGSDAKSLSQYRQPQNEYNEVNSRIDYDNVSNN